LTSSIIVVARRTCTGLTLCAGLGVALFGLAPQAAAQTAAQTASRYLAPGFTQLARDQKIVVLPPDVELFSLSAGGVAEPRADWTAAALGHMKSALAAKTGKLGLTALTMSDAQVEPFAEQISLQVAVSRSIALHHAGPGVWALPTKEGRLDWSFDDAMKPLQAASGARYGLFVWIRDSYASAERKAAMVALAVLGVGVTGGRQVGNAALVDLETGRVVWFNRLARPSGDLREGPAAAESIEALLTGFPEVR